LTNIIFGEVVTTYKYDSASNADISFKYIEYVETASNVREYFFNNVRTRFAQSRLTAGDVVGNRNMANAGVISAYFDELYSTLAGANYVLTQSGENAMAFFKANKTVTVDIATGKATVTMIVPIVTQLREIFAEMQIAFDFNQ
jgi:phage tail sheath gpL-like